MSKTEFVYVTYIAADPQKVFQALIEEEATKAYWNHINRSDWKVGSSWAHERRDGKIDLVGTVLESAPPSKLVISWASPGNLDKADAVSRVTFEIAPHEGGNTRLTVVHEDLERGSDMERGIRNGWPLVLANLKSYLETGKVMPLSCGK